MALLSVAVPMIPGALEDALSVWDSGAVLVPCGPHSERFLSVVRPSRVVGEANPRDNPRVFAEGTGLVLATSGSRGVPKAVALSRAGIEANVAAISGYLQLRQSDVVGVVLPLHYSYALVGQVFTARAARAAIVLANDTPFPRVQIERLASATVLSSVASNLAMWCDQLDAGAPKPPLRLIASAGGPFPLPLAERLKQHFPAAVLWNQYGLTEASPRVTAVSSEEPAFWRGSIGKALKGISARVVDGELCIRGPSVMLGYLDAPPLEGELFTGDLVEQDAEGYFYHRGRKDDVVKVAGERVSLDDVASMLHGLADEVSVIAMEDARAGTRLHIFYVGAAEPKTLKAALAKQVSQAVLPRHVTRLPALPRTPNGKVDVPALREKAKP